MSRETEVLKDAHEEDVFRAFVAAAGLAVPSETIVHKWEPEPDMFCLLAGHEHYFELSEVFWEAPDNPGLTLAMGLDKSLKAARLKARGKTDIVSMGRFGYPPLLSLKQSLERKLAKTYNLYLRPCSLLLYYDRQTPVEPFDLLFDCVDELTRLLSRAAFDDVWIYAHASDSISIAFGTPEYAALAAGQGVPLSRCRPAEESRSVVGRMRLHEGCVAMSFDARYSMSFDEMVRRLAARLKSGTSAV